MIVDNKAIRDRSTRVFDCVVVLNSWHAPLHFREHFGGYPEFTADVVGFTGALPKSIECTERAQAWCLTGAPRDLVTVSVMRTSLCLHVLTQLG